MNDTTPVILGYTTQAEYSMISADKAKAIGLKVHDNAPQVNLNTEGGGVITARQVKIPSLRIGKHLLDHELLACQLEAFYVNAVLAHRSNR